MTVQECVNEVKEYFPGVSDADALRQLNNVHAEICRVLPIRVNSYSVTTIVAGTAEYDLPTAGSPTPVVAEVVAAYWYESSGNPMQLESQTTRDMDELSGAWRDQPRGVPSAYYTTGGGVAGTLPKIGLYPTPNKSSDVTSLYPRLTVYVNLYETLVLSGATAGQSATLPPSCGGNLAWQYGVLKRLAERFKDERLAWFAQQEKEHRVALGHMLARAQGARPSVVASGFSYSRRV